MAGSSTTTGEFWGGSKVSCGVSDDFSPSSSQQSRNFTENGSGDSPRDNTSSSGTFFRNNERFNNGSGSGAGSNPSGNRFENRGGSGGNFKSRDGNYRAGSGRFSGSTAAPPSQGLRK
jgi:hypothetical protein